MSFIKFFWCEWKEDLRYCNYHGEKQRNIRQKKKLRKHLIVILLILVPTCCLHSRKQNVIPKLYSLRRSLPQYYQSYRLRTGKCICESQNKEKFRVRCCQRVFDEIFVILKYIFNISLAKRVFPDKLKISRVTPIFKKRNNTLVTNYRPI